MRGIDRQNVIASLAGQLETSIEEGINIKLNMQCTGVSYECAIPLPFYKACGAYVAFY